MNFSLFMLIFESYPSRKNCFGIPGSVFSNDSISGIRAAVRGSKFACELRNQVEGHNEEIYI